MAEPGEAMSAIGWAQDTPLDVVQTTALIVMTCVLIYAVWRIGRVIDGSINGLRDPLLVVVKDNAEIRRQLHLIWRRIEALEERLAAAEVAKRVEALEDRLAAVERRSQNNE
jgi:hypothetical protein